MSILIVDDQHDLADSLADVLRLEGHEVETAYSGEDALQISGQRELNLVLLDVRLPGINGVDTLVGIRGHHPDVPAYMMTGYSVAPLLQKALDYGAKGVLHKPLDLDQIIDLAELHA
jgi:DNA-binding NtrC family response regulator